MLKIVAIIPARGGSKGIPRKNVRFIGGQPLIVHSIQNALKSQYVTDVVVTTDDDEIAHISEMAGAKTIRREDKLAGDKVTLDPVINHAVDELERYEKVKYDYVITMQPTSPLLSSKSLDSAIEKTLNTDYDTVISVVDNRHLTWTKEGDAFFPNYEERKNRQELTPNFMETGGFVISKRENISDNNRFGNKIDLYELPVREAVDIDTEMDWWVAEKLLSRKRVILRVDGYKKIGTGHIYRTLLLANRMIDHELLFVCDERYSLGKTIIEKNNYNVVSFADEAGLISLVDKWKPDIIINDILDTSREYVDLLKEKGLFVCNFEDMGEGARNANLVINALYEEKYPLQNHYWGSEYFCLREEFFMVNKKEVGEGVSEVLVTFGGTDSHNYTERIIKILSQLNWTELKTITVIAGMGYERGDELKSLLSNSDVKINLLNNVKNISKYMQRADLIFTSAGRTVYEIASIGTPSIVLAQNNRELRHTFASSKNGFVNLELGYEVSDKEISDTTLEMVNNYDLRKQCSNLMKEKDLRSGIENVLNLIFGIYGKEG